MLKNRAAVAALACALAAIPARHLGQDSKAFLAGVSKAMGADDLRTIQFSGMGSNAGIGQNPNPNTRWPLVRVKSYTQEIDIAGTASHVQLVRVQNNADQTQERYLSPASSWGSQFSFWITPFGFLKGASANNASVRSETVQGTQYNVVSFSLENKYKVVGYINDRNLVERVQTWIDNDVLGDMLVETSYDVYKDFGGVKFPTSIIEKQGGFPTLILSVTDVRPNASFNIQPPANPAPANAAQSVSVQTEKVADGVFYLKGGTHHSVAVEFADHVAVIEAPLNEARSAAVITSVKQAIPNKPIRYLINTHHHFDHSGGLRTYVDEGATIVTHDTNTAFYQQVLAPPRTLNPDRLSRSQKQPNIESFADKKVLSDDTRTLELHLIKGNPHNDGILMAFLPKEKILIEVDVFTPQAPGANAAAAAINPSTVNTVENVEKLKLDFETILPLHGPGAAPRAEIYKAINKPAPDISVILAAAPPPPPVDPGLLAMQTACTVCHTVARIQAKNMSMDDWQMLIDDMKGKGAILRGNDEALLLEYLVKNYGPR
jgi:glyoxylase-like metal-dependent hydrolase (beta-lactamase superfamily II)